MIHRCLSRAFASAGSLLTWGETTYGWGRPVSSQLRVPAPVEGFNDVVQVSTGAYHLAFLTTSGAVFTAGLGSRGRLGHGSEQTLETPQRIGDFAGQIIRLACGERHSLALSSDGTIYSWGYGGAPNIFFRFLPFCTGSASPLGHGVSADSLLPKAMETLPEPATQIAAGKDFSLAIGKSGTVFGWGCGMKKLGIEPTSLPVPIETINKHLHRKHINITKIKAAHKFAMFLCDDGVLYAVGRNNGGVFGTRDNPLIRSDDFHLQPAGVVTTHLHGEPIIDFEVSANSLILRTSSGAIFYSGMHSKFQPVPFPTTARAERMFATYDSVGVVDSEGNVQFLNDQILDNSYKQGEVMISDEKRLAGKILEIGGTYQLRYALVL